MGDSDTDRDTLGVELNEELIYRLQARGDIVRPELADAFRAAPRHRFLPPQMPLEEVYRDAAVPLLRTDPLGRTPGGLLSSSTMPGILGRMLEAAGTKAGHRVLQFGTGPGWFAGLIGAMVDESGSVLSLEIEEALIPQARRSLAGLGLSRVSVRVDNGLLGAPEAAPLDQILITATADSVPGSWIAQLGPGGVVMVPLQVSPAFGSYPMVLLRRDRNTAGISGHPVPGLARLRFVNLRAEAGAVGRSPGTTINRFLIRYREAGLPRDRLDGALVWASLDHAGKLGVDDVGMSDSLQRWASAGMPGLERYWLRVIPRAAEPERPQQPEQPQAPELSGPPPEWTVEWKETVLRAGIA